MNINMKTLGWQMLLAFVALLGAYIWITSNGGDGEGLVRLVVILGGIFGSTGFLGQLLIKNKEQVEEVKNTVAKVQHQTNGGLEERMLGVVHKALTEREQAAKDAAWRATSDPANQRVSPDDPLMR